MTDTVGLDIGHTAIKAIRLRRTFGGRESLTCFEQKFPIDANKSLSEENRAQILKQFVHAHGLRRSRVVTALPCSHLFMRTLALPFHDAKKLSLVIPSEVESMIPLPLEDVAVDYQRLTHQAQNGKLRPDSASHVLVAAVPKSRLTSHVRSLAEAGIDPGAIQVDALALLSLAQHLGQHTSVLPPDLAIIDLGASKTTICLSHQGDPWLARTIGYGTDHLTAGSKHIGPVARADHETRTDAAPHSFVSVTDSSGALSESYFLRPESTATDSLSISPTPFPGGPRHAPSTWPESAKTDSLTVAPDISPTSFPGVPRHASSTWPESAKTDSFPRSHTFDALVRELRRTLHAYEATTQTRLRSVWYCGGGASSQDLTNRLGRCLELESIDLPQSQKSQCAPEYGVAFGLAVMGHTARSRTSFSTSSVGAGIDLKRVMDKTLAQLQDRWRQLLYVGFAGLAIMLLFFGDLSVQMVLKHSRLEELKTALRKDFQTTFTGIDVVSNELEQAKSTVSRVRKVTDRLGKDEPQMVALLTDLTRHIPKGVLMKMQTLTIEQDTIQVEAETDSFESIEKVKAGLLQFPGVTDVVVRDARIGKSHNQVLFRITLTRGIR